MAKTAGGLFESAGRAEKAVHEIEALGIRRNEVRRLAETRRRLGQVAREILRAVPPEDIALRDTDRFLDREGGDQRIHQRVKVGAADMQHVPMSSRCKTNKLRGRQALIDQYGHVEQISERRHGADFAFRE
jgi:hypothetical protein